MKDLRIVVLHRGFVLIGWYEKNGDYHKLINPYCIRRWGTCEGLGELAIKGPLTNTILDKETETEFHFSQIIRTILCDKSKWTKYYDDK